MVACEYLFLCSVTAGVTPPEQYTGPATDDDIERNLSKRRHPTVAAVELQCASTELTNVCPDCPLIDLARSLGVVLPVRQLAQEQPAEEPRQPENVVDISTAKNKRNL